MKPCSTQKLALTRLVPLVDTWQQRWMTEESRRHDADLWRQALPEAQRAEALAEENQRRTAWDRENPRP